MHTKSCHLNQESGIRNQESLEFLSFMPILLMTQPGNVCLSASGGSDLINPHLIYLIN